jgi:hypothetical protein
MTFGNEKYGFEEKLITNVAYETGVAPRHCDMLLIPQKKREALRLPFASRESVLSIRRSV